MQRSLLIAAGVLVLGAAGVVLAAVYSPVAPQSAAAQVATTRTATFTIENMTCAICPITVKSAMKGVNGVRSVEVDLDAKTATVIFDPSVTSTEAIAAASTNAGYPATARS